jgi:6-phosphogluconate dehydrogenase (decarboxylating)
MMTHIFVSTFYSHKINKCFIIFTSRSIMKLSAIRRFSSNARNEMKSKMIIFGGNGYVGQNIIKAANELSNDIDIVVISRSGGKNVKKDKFCNVSWIEGDLTGGDESWKSHLTEASCAISCVGAFGSNAHMEKVNGDANINAISSCLKAGVGRFTFISTVDNNLPSFVLSGYSINFFLKFYFA